MSMLFSMKNFNKTKKKNNSNLRVFCIKSIWINGFFYKNAISMNDFIHVSIDTLLH